MAKKLSEMTDEERYGKVGAEIRRLDPEAYKKRPKTMEGNLKLLEELRGKSKPTPARQMSAAEFGTMIERNAADEDSAASMPAFSSRGPSRRGGRRSTPEETEASNKRIQAIKASEAMERNRATLPSDRATGYRSQAQETGMSASERAERARDYSKNVAMTAGAGRLAGVTAEAQPLLRARQMFRRFKTSRANEAERAADVAGEASRRGMSRRDIPSYSERYRASEAAASARGMRGGGSVKKYAKGGSIKSSASRRADGIAQRGKTKGRII